MTKIAINGFGRIGRLTFRRILENHPNLEVVAVNDLTDPETLAYLLKHDSVYGILPNEIKVKEGKLIVDGREILVLAESDPLELPWKKLGVDVVIESTGRFTAKSEAQKHLEAGAKKVIISANSKDADLSVVLGVNEADYDPKSHHIVANCSCTTNAAAPVIKILDENFGIEKAYLSTIHAVTATQSLVDASKKDVREGRAAFTNIIPASTGAQEAVVRVLPHLKNRLSGSAYRVPVISGSLLEIIAQTKKEATKKTINQALKKAAGSIIEYSQTPLVSTDIIGNAHSAIIDSELTEVLENNLVKVVAWYDNEYGYSCRLAEITEFVGKKL
jgi:glyceraldehyde 3-phosphate dehydrogenase